MDDGAPVERRELALAALRLTHQVGIDHLLVAQGFGPEGNEV